MEKSKVTLEELQEITKDLGISLKEVKSAIKEFVKENNTVHKGVAKEQEKTEAALKEVAEAQKETEASGRETRVFLRDLGKKIDKVNGNLTSKWGKFVERLVEGDLANLLVRWTIKAYKVESRMEYPSSRDPRGEFDLVAIGEKELVIVEVKSTLNEEDVDDFVEKVQECRGFLPRSLKAHKDKPIYGGVAYLEADRDALKKAKNQGLFIIKAPGGESQISTITNKEGFEPREF